VDRRDSSILGALAVRRPRAVIAEGDADLRARLVYLLERAGYDTVVAADGKAALRTLTELGAGGPGRSAIVVFDIELPDLPEPEALAGLREHSGAVALVLLAASLTHEKRMRAARLGATCLVEKPVDAARFQNLLRDLRAAAR
jgi:CheY-like chemotaxis protein